MPPDIARIRERYFRHVRWTRWWLRWLPRRAHVHRHPLLSRFSGFVRRRSYLWSLRPSAVVPALYSGFLLTFLPVMGIQVPTAIVLAMVLRANLPVLVALQFISNPLTIGFIYPFQFFLGEGVIDLFGSHVDMTAADVVAQESGWVEKGMRAFLAVSVGGAIVGYVCGFLSSVAYRVISARSSQAFAEFRLHHPRAPRRGTGEASTPPDPAAGI